MALNVGSAYVRYETWPSSGTTVTNTGTGPNGNGNGSGSGVERTNQYIAWAPSYTGQRFTSSSDAVTVSRDGAGTNNIDFSSGITIEALFKWDSSSTNPCYLWSQGSNFYIRYYRTSNYIEFSRSAITDDDIWRCTIPAMTNGAAYDLQVSWGMPSSQPIVKLNNVSYTPTHYHANYPNVGYWASVYGSDAIVFNNSSKSGAWRGTLGIFRYHHTNLDSAALSGNYTIDWGRVFVQLEVTAATLTPPTAAAAIPTFTAPTADPNHWFQNEIPNATAAGIDPPVSSDITTTVALGVTSPVTTAVHAPTVAGARYADVPPIPGYTLTHVVPNRFTLHTTVEEQQQ